MSDHATHTSTLLIRITLTGTLAIACTAQSIAANKQDTATPQDNILSIGIGGIVSARYPGSDQRGFVVGPTLEYTMTNGFFASTLHGIGYGSQAGRFSYRAALGYRGGRKEKDNAFLFNPGSDHLKGMGDIKNAATLNLDAGYQVLDWLSLGASARIPLTARESGTTFHFNVSGIMHQTSTDTVSWTATTAVGNKKYMQTWFGVDATQSANSGFTQHKASSGIYEVGANVHWQHTFNQHWSLNTLAGITKLTGDAANSPVTKRKVSPTAGVMLKYQF